METDKHFLFYSPLPPVDGKIILDDTESHHARHVLRIKQSDTVNISNGKGTIYICTCDGFSDNNLVATINNNEFISRRCDIHLFVALPERDAFETILTECSALGVHAITPVVASHCQRSWWKESWVKYKERFTTKMIVSMKQSLNPYLTLLNDPIAFEDALLSIHGTLIVADVEGVYLKNVQAEIDLQTTSVFIGPPGGFCEQEINLLHKKGALKVKMCDTRLRTELACTVACSQIIAFC